MARDGLSVSADGVAALPSRPVLQRSQMAGKVPARATGRPGEPTRWLGSEGPPTRRPKAEAMSK